jgi:hypothetical protein
MTRWQAKNKNNFCTVSDQILASTDNQRPVSERDCLWMAGAASTLRAASSATTFFGNR